MSKGFYGIRALMSATVLIGAINFAARAETCTVDGVTYTYTVSDGSAELKSGSFFGDRAVPVSTSGALVIPSSLDGYPVTSIGVWAFQGCTSLTSIVIPDSVTSIGELAFEGCTNLTSVTIPDTVEFPGGNPFVGTRVSEFNVLWSGSGRKVAVMDGVLFSVEDCWGRSTLIAYPKGRDGAYTLPDGVERIENCAFEGCTGLTSVVISEKVWAIGDSAFRGCTSLTSVIIPDGVGCSIGSFAFEGCTALISVEMPEELLMDIGVYAFVNCTSLTSMKIPEYAVCIRTGTFRNCTSLRSVTLSDGVQKIEDYAFDGCTSLTSITIPKNVYNIEGGFGHSGIEEVVVDEENETYCAIDGVLFTKDGTKLIAYPSGREGKYEIPNGVATIGAYAFHGSAGLTSIVIPNSVTNIAKGAFYRCSNLNSVEIPNGVTKLEYSVFYGCTNLNSVVIPNSVTKIDGGWGFGDCVNLTSITIPSSVIYIDSWTFSDCEKLSEIVFMGVPPSECAGTPFERINKNAIGRYLLDYEKEWYEVIDEEGKWNGLTMFAVGEENIVYTNLKGVAHSNPTTYHEGTVVNFAAVTNVVGYTFVGWTPAAITEEMTGPQTVRANWVANGYTIKYDANGGEGVMEDAACVYDEGRTMASNGFRRTGYSFLGWAIERDGDVVYKEGVVVSNLVSEAGAEITLYAVWNYQSLVAEADDGAVDLSVGKVYNGCLYDSAADLVGTIQVKAAKANGGESKITAAIQVAGERKITVRGVLDLDEGKMEVVAKDGRELYLVLGANGLKGSFGEYTIDGARDVFSSKASADKSAAGDVVGMLKSRGVMTIAWGGEDGWNGLSVTVGTRGRVKVAGVLVGGAKVSVNAQMIMGEEWCVVPVGYVKKDVRLAFNIWIARDGSAAEVVGLGEDVVIGYGTNFEESAAFTLDSAAVLGLLGEDVYEEYLPDGVEITLKGSKWILPRAGRVVLKKGEIDESKLGENPAGLRLAYRAKSGTFSGSFKVYRNVEGRVKATTVSVSGVMIDGKGYGTATVKKVGSVPITIE